MDGSSDVGKRESVFRPIATCGNLTRLAEAATVASQLVYRDKPFLDRLNEVFADLPKFRSGFNVSGRVLKLRRFRHLEIALATSEAMIAVPEEGACELTVIVRDPLASEEMISSLNVGDIIEVRGKILPFAYSEDDGERVVSLTLVASNVNVVETARR